MANKRPARGGAVRRKTTTPDAPRRTASRDTSDGDRTASTSPAGGAAENGGSDDPIDHDSEDDFVPGTLPNKRIGLVWQEVVSLTAIVASGSEKGT